MNGKQKAESARSLRFELRLSEHEKTQFIELEKALGLSRSEIVRIRVLENTKGMLVNAKELLGKLDIVGAEMGRAGNNINQLARHANVLNKSGLLYPTIVADFNRLLSEYISLQVELEKSMRQLIRLIGNRSP